MTEWRFHGRNAELKKLAADLLRPEFDTLAIRGRRGIGKSTLLVEAVRRMGDGPPVLMFDLRLPSEEDLDTLNVRLVAEVNSCLPEFVLVDLPDADPGATGQMRFAEIIGHLLSKRAVVCLDEFHHAEGLGLTGAIGHLIDEFRQHRQTQPTGKLIVTGSHQQRFDALLLNGQPLFGRFRVAFVLRQWRLPTVLGMAEEQGFLRSPGRLLTLWTAFGGIPRNWEAFASSDDDAGRLRDFAAWPDDRSWRRAFLDWQRLRMEEDPRERFDNRSCIELAPPHREVLLWLAMNAPRGAAIREFPMELRSADRDPPLGESLEVLSSYLELMKQTWEFQGGGEGKWSVADNNTLFQISVFPEIFGRKIRSRLPSQPRSLPAERLRPLEGLALRRLAAAWLGSLPGMSYARHGVWRTRRNPPVGHPDGTILPPLADIDLLGLQGELSDPDSVLYVGGCKRSPRRHDPAGTDQQVDELLNHLGRDGDAGRMNDMRRQRLLISPEFTAGQRRRFGASGHVCVDIPGMRLMARELESNQDTDPMQLMLLADRCQLRLAEGHGPKEDGRDPNVVQDRDGGSVPGK